MTESDLLLILIVIKNNGDSSFVENTLGYYETAVLLASAEKQGFIIESDDGYKLTPSGLNYINKVNKEKGRKGIDKCIAPYPGAWNKGKRVSEVYVPKN